MNKSFPIKLITKRSSRLDGIFNALCFIGIIGLLIFYVLMSLSEKSTVELKAFWFIKGVPLWIKQLTFYSIITLVLALIINFLNKKRTNGELIINNEEISITTAKKTISIRYEKIREIAIVAKAFDYRGPGSENLKIIFKTKADEIIRVRLLFYLMADELIEAFNVLVVKDIKIISSELDPYWPD